MNYPSFNLQKALQGEPVVLQLYDDKIVKCYISSSKFHGNNRFIVEFTTKNQHYSDTYSINKLHQYVLGMWVEPVKFDYWNVLSKDVMKIKRHVEGWWILVDKDHQLIATISSKACVQGFFPDCPAGTVIERL